MIEHTFRLYDLHGELLEEANDIGLMEKIDGFVIGPTPSEKQKYPDASLMVLRQFGDPPVQYLVTTSTMVPDDVTGAAALPANVRFVGDSATFDSLKEIRGLADKTAMKFVSSSARRPVASDFVDYAMQVLEIVYKNSKE